MLSDFREVWAMDFEYRGQAGERPSPVCLVGRELKSGRLVRQWLDGVISPTSPIPTGPDILAVAYYASAEIGCFLALGWPLPASVLDLYAEYRCERSGLPTPHGRGLLGALASHGLPAIDAAEKDAMRTLILRGDHTAEEQVTIMDYCQTDVDALARLLPAMLPRIDLPRALLRGRYMIAAARMEWVGVPIDTDRLDLFRRRWEGVKRQLILRIDKAFGVYDGMRFKIRNWVAWLRLNSLSWPMLPSGLPALDDDTWFDMSRLYPAIRPLRELRVAVSRLKLQKLVVGTDGRNRVMLSAFASKAGRNQPSNSKHIFGPSAWIRSLIRPGPGMALAYIDWSQQELAIAAALSGDHRMQEAYLSGDFYLKFGQMAGVIPTNASKQSHEAERDQFKVVALGVLYGLSEWGLVRKLSEPASSGTLLRYHRETFRDFWRWSQGVQDTAMLTGRLLSAYGWPVHVGPDANPRSLRNFAMQANGAEMMRLACVMATEAGISVCCPVHDALLVEAPISEIDDVVARTQAIMQRAAELVLGDFVVRSEAKVVRYPDRYRDPRGVMMWDLVCELCGVES